MGDEVMIHGGGCTKGHLRTRSHSINGNGMEGTAIQPWKLKGSKDTTCQLAAALV